MRKMEKLGSDLFRNLTMLETRRAVAADGTVGLTERDFNTHNPVTGKADTVREFDHGALD